ncbi:hypothetical protein TWF694_011363 [Orbilia ellipsospora]|uniref:Uncharacterized protein n=1 Tax=Orbilia ellipsospora TaxID=2528407 RepID=A0AAV9X593_9PEZI
MERSHGSGFIELTSPISPQQKEIAPSGNEKNTTDDPATSGGTAMKSTTTSGLKKNNSEQVGDSGHSSGSEGITRWLKNH